MNELESMEPLARRLVACRGFRWIAGMRAVAEGGYSIRIRAKGEGDVRRGRGRSLCADYVDGVGPVLPPGHEWLPDLTDPATVGLLPAMVREALDDLGMTCRYQRFHNGVVKWAMLTGGVQQPGWEGATETEAWIVAMESVK